MMLRFKKNAGAKIKEKVVFKFQFHVTRVPQSGWEKLKVSLIPQDTGKRTNKTEKAFVEYGCCRWADPIVETTKLTQDSQTRQYEEKLYKFVVGVRSKVLGEVIINLADFANSLANSVALPLQNCHGNTVLHVKIHSLTSLKKSRELSAQDGQYSDSEEEIPDNNSVASSTSQALSGPIPKSVSSPRESMSRYSTDTNPLEPLTPSAANAYNGDQSPTSSVNGGGGYERRRRRFGSQGSFPSILPPETPQLSRASSSALTLINLDSETPTPRRANLVPPLGSNLDSETPTPRRSSLAPPPGSNNLENETPRRARSLSFRGQPALDASESPFSEKAVQELRMEAVTWQRRARTLTLEVQKLKQEIATSRKPDDSSSMEKLQLQLESEKLEREELAKKIDEMQRSAREMKSELEYEKEANSNASTQLRKAQDSNMQLVLAIQDLEESLEEQRREVEEISSANQSLEVAVHESKLREQNLEKEWSEKVSLGEETIRALESKLQSVEKGQRDRNFEDVERELKELTDENMELIFKLNEATKELERRIVVVTDKRNGITIQELDVDPEEVDRLRNMIAELEKKLAATEEFHQLQHSSNEKLMVRLQSLIQGLKNANAELEKQLRSSSRDLESLNEELVRERGVIEGLRYENASLTKEQERLTSLVSELSSRKDELELQMISLMSQARKYEDEMADLVVKLKFKQLNIKELEDRSLQLEMLNSGLEMKMQDSQELDKANKLRILELEAQLGKLSEELEAGNSCRRELEARVEALVLDSERSSSLMRSEQERNKAQVDALVRQIASVKMELNTCVASKGVLEMRAASLEKELGSELRKARSERDELLDMSRRLEEEARNLELELESLQAQRDDAERRAFESEQQRKLVVESLESYKVKCSSLEKVCEKQAHAERELKAEVSGHLTRNSALEKKLAALEKSRENLDSELRRAKAESSELMLSLTRLGGEARALESELEGLKAQKDEAEARVLKSEQQRELVQASLESYKMKSSSLDSQLQRTRVESSELNQKVARLENEARSLESQLESTERRVFEAEKQKTLVASSLESYKMKCVGLEKVCEKQAQAERELKAQVEGLKAEVSDHLTRNSALERRVSTLEKIRESLDSELQRARTESSELMVELTSLKGEARSLESELEEVKTQKEEAEQQRELVSASLESFKVKSSGLEAQLQRARVESSELMQNVARLESEAQSLELELGSLRGQKSEAERRVFECENQNSLLTSSLESSKMKCGALETRCEDLQSQVEQLKGELSDHRSAKDLLVSRVEELERALGASKASSSEAIRRLEGRVSAYEKHNAQTVERKLELMAELESVQEELESFRAMKAAAENETIELRRALEESRRSYGDLEANLLLVEAERSFQAQARKQLESELQEKVREKALLESRARELRENIEALEQEQGHLEKEIESLKDQASRHLLAEETLQKRVEELEAIVEKLRIERGAAEEQVLKFSGENEALRARISEAKAEFTELEMKLENEQRELEKKLGNLEEKLGASELQVLKFCEENEALRARVSESKLAFSELEMKVENERHAHVNDVLELENKLRNLEESLRASELEQEQQVFWFSEENKALRTRLSESKQAFGDLEMKLDSVINAHVNELLELENKLGNLEEKLGASELQRAAGQKQVLRFSEENEALRARVSESKRAFNDLEVKLESERLELENKLKNLEEKLGASELQQAAAEKQVFQFSEENEGLQARLSEAKRAFNELEAKFESESDAHVNEQRELENKLWNLEEKLGASEELVVKCSQENEALQTRLSESKRVFNELEMKLVNERLEVEKKLRNLEEKLRVSELQQAEAENQVVKRSQENEELWGKLSVSKLQFSELEMKFENETHAHVSKQLELENKLRNLVENTELQQGEAEKLVVKCSQENEALRVKLSESKLAFSELELKLESERLELGNKLKNLEDNLKFEQDEAEKQVVKLSQDNEGLRGKLSELKLTFNKLEVKLENEQREFEEKVKNLEENLRASELQQAAAEKQLLKFSEENEALRARLSEAKLAFTELEMKLENERLELENNLKNLEEKLRASELEQDAAEERVLKCSEEKEALRASVSDTKLAVTELEMKLESESDAHEHERLELETKLNDLEASFRASLSESEMKLENDHHARELERKELENKLEDLSHAHASEQLELETKLMELATKLRASELQHAECRKKNEALQASLSESKQSFSELETKLQNESHAREHERLELESNLQVSFRALLSESEMKLESDRSAHERERQELENRLIELDAQVDEFLSSKSQLEDRIAELDSSKSSMERIKDETIAELEAQVRELRSSIALLEKSLHERSLVEQLEAERKLEGLSQKLRAASQECSRLAREKSELEEQLVKANAEIELRTIACDSQAMRLRAAGCEIEQSADNLQRITSQMEDAVRSMDLLTISSIGSTSKLAKLQQIASSLGGGSMNGSTKLELQPVNAESHKQEELEKMSSIQVRLQELGSKLALQQNEELLQELEELKREYEHEQHNVETQVCNLLEILQRKHEEKEAALQSRIDYLEGTLERQADAGLEQFQAELTRLQDQLSFSAQRERELVSKLNTQEILEKEIRRLQQDNEQLVETIARLKAASEWDDPQARIVLLESELNEALAANARCKSRLENDSNPEADEQCLDLMMSYKKRSSELEMDLKDLHERYSGMSLQFAQVVAEKEQLGFELRSLQKSSEILTKSSSF